MELKLRKSGFHFADWLALDRDDPAPFGATDPLYIASAYYYKCVSVTAMAAETLGYPEAGEMKKLAREILTALREKYFQNGICTIETQTAHALAICFGLTEDPKEEGNALNRLVKEKRGHLDTGFVGTPLLLPMDGVEPSVDLRQGVVPDVLPGMAMSNQALASVGPAN